MTAAISALASAFFLSPVAALFVDEGATALCASADNSGPPRFDTAILCAMANTDFFECKDLEPLRALRRTPGIGDSVTVGDAVQLCSSPKTSTSDLEDWLHSLGIVVSGGNVRIDATEQSPVSEFYWALGMPLKATDIRREATEVEFDAPSEAEEARVYVWFPLTIER